MAISLKKNNFQLTEDACALLAEWGYPNVTSGSVHHTHPLSALIRNSFEYMVINTHKGQRIKDAGGNHARHSSKHAEAGVHSCCPYTSPDDIIREVSRDYSNDGATYCRNLFQQCEYQADVYMFNHSMYYITQADMLCIPPGATIYSMHHLYPGPGIYCAGEMQVHGTEEQWEVHATGNNSPYRHPQCWLSGECVIPGRDGTVIAFKLIRTFETAHVFKGRVMSGCPYLLKQPTFAGISVATSKLEDYLLADVMASTVDSKTVHVMMVKARTYCITHDIPVPPNIEDVIARVVNRATAKTHALFCSIDLDAVVRNNEEVAMFQALLPERISIWRRLKSNLSVQIGRTVEQLGYVRDFTITPVVRKVLNLTAYCNSKVKQAIWYRNTGPVVPTHTWIPANDWLNEICAVYNRALPAQMTPKIDVSIIRAAEELARKIGKITTPLAFEDWLSRFPPKRREELTRARYDTLNANVEMFVKTEQLEDDKDPRAIQARKDSYKARAGPWVAALEERCLQVVDFLVKKLNDEERAKKVAELKTRASNIVELDFTRFDRHCSKQLLEATEHLVYDVVLPKEIAALMHKQLHNNCKTANGVTYQVQGSRMSGDVNTSIGNCIIVACMCKAAGIPWDALLVEGDDMIAAVTNKERDSLNLGILTATGMKPQIITSHDAGSFCSRYDVVDSLGEPRRVRHPCRDIRRYGFSIHGEDRLEKARRHYYEWRGVPMLGPVYTELYSALQPTENIEQIPITAQARCSFYTTFNISFDLQESFEKDADSRARIFTLIEDAKKSDEELQAPATGSYPSRDRGSKVPRVTEASRERGHHPSRISAGIDRVVTPGRESKHVRDVPLTRTREICLQSSSGHNDKRRDPHGRGLRRTRRDPVLPRNCSIIAKVHGTGVEGPHPSHPDCTSDETKVANNQ